jgi:hypothetical protein
METKYKNGKIYKLCNADNSKVYIGSTIQTLTERKQSHKDDYKRWKKGTHGYVTSFDVYKDDIFEGVTIELLEDFPCETRKELNKREGYWISTISCVNKLIAGRTDKEYRTDNKEKEKQRHKKYELENKEVIKEKRKKYKLENKEKIKEQNKKYLETGNHHEEQLQRQREWYIKNKDILNEKRKQKYTCECGKTLRTDAKSSHNKTIFHTNFINSK